MKLLQIIKPDWMALFLVVIVLSFSFQGARGIWEPDEGFYVTCAASMLKCGDFLIPRLNNQPFLDKPPLTYWGIALGMSAFGLDEWGARFFHALVFSLTAILVACFGSSLWDRKTGVLAGFIYATSIVPFVAANIATPDTPLALSATLAFYCFWHSLRAKGWRSGVWTVMIGVAFGFGFLAKGPAILIMAGAMGVYLWFTKEWKKILTLWAIPALVLSAAIGLTWYVLVIQLFPTALPYFWDNQIWGRLVSAKYERNSEWYGPLAIYLPTMTLGALPWSIGWPFLLKLVHPVWRVRKWWNDLARSRQVLLLAIWVAVPLLVLSLARSRLPLYVLPLFSPLCMLTARSLSLYVPKYNLFSFRTNALISLFMGIWVLFLIGFKFGWAHYPTEKDSRAMWVSIKDYIGTIDSGDTEIIIINERLNGLGFYVNNELEEVTTRKNPYPFFVRTEQLHEEIEEMRTEQNRCIFLLKSKYLNKVRQSLIDARIPFHISDMPYNYILIRCHPVEGGI